MRAIIESLFKTVILVISGGFILVGKNLAYHPEQFQIVNVHLSPILITVQLVIEYLPSFALISAGAGGFYVISMPWEKKKEKDS